MQGYVHPYVRVGTDARTVTWSNDNQIVLRSMGYQMFLVAIWLQTRTLSALEPRFKMNGRNKLHLKENL